MNQVADYRLHHGSLGILVSCTFLQIAVQINLFFLTVRALNFISYYKEFKNVSLGRLSFHRMYCH